MKICYNRIVFDYKKIIYILIVLTSFLFLASCSDFSRKLTQKEFITLLENDELEWNDILRQTRQEQGVHLYYSGHDSEIDSSLDFWLRILDKYFQEEHLLISVNKIKNIKELAKSLENQNALGINEIGDGIIDVVILDAKTANNFLEKGLLYEGWSKYLPNFKNFSNNSFDLGMKQISSSKEISKKNSLLPWYREYFVTRIQTNFVRLDEMPLENFDDLEQWIISNPGDFTYVDPREGDISFIKSLVLSKVDSQLAQFFTQRIENIPASTLEKILRNSYVYLKNINPYLWKKGDSYPLTYKELFKLYVDREVHIRMDWGNTGMLEKELRDSLVINFPQNHVMTSARYLLIPNNAQDLASAMVFINKLASVELQASNRNYTGMDYSIDPSLLDVEESKLLYENIDNNYLEFEDSQLIDGIHYSWDDFLEELWEEYVYKESNESFGYVVRTILSSSTKK